MTIAGSDPSGGAGLQADLKTFHQHRVYGTSVVTLVTVQNTRSVARVELMPPDLVSQQLDAVTGDLSVRAAKTGALGSAGIVRAVTALAEGFSFPLVVDPVMVSKHGAPLMDADAHEAIKGLMAHAALVTPNAPEAAVLTGRPVETIAQAEDAAHALAELGPSVLLKGGHLAGEATDILLHDGTLHRFSAKRVKTRHTHGTGCTYAAAITARLALGETLVDAVRQAKAWMHCAILSAPGLGSSPETGNGPVNHFAPLDGTSEG